MKRTFILLVLLGLLITACTQRSERKPASPEISSIVKQCGPSIVMVLTKDESGQEVGLGSGIIVSSDGKVVTNYHVLAGAHSATVKLTTGAFYTVAGVIASLPEPEKDIVMFKIEASNLPIARLGNSDKLQRGDKVIAIGNPKGLENSVSDGIVSNISQEEKTRTIQFTAPISPGSSGGALLNLQGEVVGITTKSLTEGQNLNFAVPINEVRPLLNQQKILSIPEYVAKHEDEIPSPPLSFPEPGSPEAWPWLYSFLFYFLPSLLGVYLLTLLWFRGRIKRDQSPIDAYIISATIDVLAVPILAFFCLSNVIRWWSLQTTNDPPPPPNWLVWGALAAFAIIAVILIHMNVKSEQRNR